MMNTTIDYTKLSKEQLIEILMVRDRKITSLEQKLGQFSTCCNNPEPLNINNRLLSLAAIRRYSRQLILPEFGPKGQICLQNSSVLIVGCGGLGCPSSLYLAAAGIGKIGLVDYDNVELNNLHRQILHNEKEIGMAKALSIMKSLIALNSTVQCVPHVVDFNSENALEIISQYDIILDCTDNVATRYLLNDACVLSNKPLVSGSALRFEGQLMVYNYQGGPCYRCIFPSPPPPSTVTNCSDGGVIGVVPGIIGLLQALEVIKIASGIGTVNNRNILLFNGLDFTFRNVKLRNKQKSCHICGQEPTINKLIDYEMFCGAKATDKDKGINILPRKSRITVEEYKKISNKPHVLLDVRLPVELEICVLPNTFNVPFQDLDSDENIKLIEDKLARNGFELLVCICHRGNDSQHSVSLLSEKFGDRFQIVDVIGGLDSWAMKIDPEFPIY